jgi:8-oxo-dGTP pyrophosphatase MutT (NUDIX family)
VRFYLFSGTENGIYLRWNRKGEEIEDTAMREVEEETGVNQLWLQNYKKTYHILSVTGNKLKITHWFEMESSFEGVPKVS